MPDALSKQPLKTNLARLLSTLALAILLQAILATFSFSILSSVRAYVAGEGFWTRGQKDAIYYLTEYVISGNEKDFGLFQAAVAVPLADRAARIALESNQPNIAVARKSFIAGHNHSDDVDGMIWLFRNFQWFEPFARAVEYWRSTDALLSELVSLGDSLHKERTSRPADLGYSEQSFRYFQGSISKIQNLNRRLTRQAAAFSNSLGVGSRLIANLLTAINIAIAAFLIFVAGWHTRRLTLHREAFERALRAEKERAVTTLSSLGEAVISVDAHGRIEYLNVPAEQLIAVSLANARGMELGSLICLRDPETQNEVDLSSANLFAALPFTGEPKLLNSLGRRPIAVSATAAPIKLGSLVVGAVFVLHDKTAEQTFIERLSWQASHDELTQLPNRRHFERRLDDIVSCLAKRSSSHALMLLDLDQFKIVNDTCGHAIGDRLLRQAVSELQKHLRADDLLARLGGDEFAVIIEDCNRDKAVSIAEQLRQSIERLNFVWNDHAFRITISIGLVHFGDVPISVKDALRAADVACYVAKEKGRNKVQIHNSADLDLQTHLGEMSWVQRIQVAFEEDRFCLYTQKIASLDNFSDDASGVEFLVRMRDEAGELVLPNRFVPAAERYGLMLLIDRWVISTAFRAIAEWQASGINPPSFYGINLSGGSLDDGKMALYIEKQMHLNGIAPERVCFEITETAAIRNIHNAQKLICALRRLGCRFALDDFGTSLSSLAYLKQLPVDCLKIDGAFVRNMLDNAEDRAMVELIAQLAKIMGKTTVAEFVESHDILNALKEIGVNYAQGYAVGLPQPLEISIGEGELDMLKDKEFCFG
jgi:diguanylate cyclase (GGDEF)-like protein